MAYKYCPNFHIPQDSNSKYCWRCGETLVTKNPMVCPKCSEELDSLDDFCHMCGARVRWANDQVIL